MRKLIVLTCLAASLGLVLWGMSGQAGQEAAKPGPGAKNEAPAGEKPPVSVEAVNPRSADISEGVDVVGNLSPKNEALVRSEVPGQVLEVHVTEWVPVKKGDPLVRLDTRDVEATVNRSQASVDAARANLLHAEVGMNRAVRELNRLLSLKEAGLVTQQALDDARTEREAGEARVAAAKAQIKVAQDELSYAKARLAKGTLLAPMDGVVSMRDVNVGNMVEAGGAKVLFRIVDNRLLDLTMSVPSRYLGQIKIGQRIIFTSDAFPDDTFSGSLKFINPTVNETDRSIKIIAEVPNDPVRLRGGLFVKGRIITSMRQGIVQIPRTAVISANVAENTAEIMVVDDGRARVRKIKTGMQTGDTVEVVSGLELKDLVVVRGGFNAKDGDRVKIVAAGGK